MADLDQKDLSCLGIHTRRQFVSTPV